MAKEIVIWCQIHLVDHDKKVPGTEEEVTLNGKPQTIDLCADCRHTLVAPLEAALAEYGEPIKTPAKAGRKTPTPTAPTTSVFSGKKSDEFLNKQGLYVCPECGREFEKPQGIGRHMVSHRD